MVGTERSTVPRLLVLTDRHRSQAAGRALTVTVVAAVGAGAPAILLREKDLPPGDRRQLAGDLAAVTSGGGALLFVASDAELARTVGAAGVHLAAGEAAPTASTRRHASDDLGRGLVVGRSCHDGAEVARAVAEGLDYITISPVAPSASKPGYGPALGPDGFAELAAGAGDLATLALGGIGPGNVARLRAAGAHGVAVMGAVMGARDPAKAVAGLLDQLAQEDSP